MTSSAFPVFCLHLSFVPLITPYITTDFKCNHTNVANSSALSGVSPSYVVYMTWSGGILTNPDPEVIRS